MMGVGSVSTLPLTERLRPTRLGEVVGNPRARADLAEWAARWKAGKPPARRAALLIGPPGVGKTSAAIALAHDMGWTLVEMNASEARNQTAIERVAGRASITHSLGDHLGPAGSHRALILLDEADCLSGRATETGRKPPEPISLRDFLQGRYGSIERLNTAWGLAPERRPRPFEGWGDLPRSPGSAGWARLPAARRDLDDWRASGKTSDVSDRGGLGAIARLVRSTRQPVLLTVNDDRPLSRYSPVFRTAVVRIHFYPLTDAEVAARLASITRSEKISVGSGVLDAIVRRVRGDFRAALNDLEAVSPLPPGPSQLEVLGTRDNTVDFAEFVEQVLSTPRYYRSAEVRDRLDAPPDDLLPWIDENIPLFAQDPVHREAAFGTLGTADRFLTKARRARVYGLWAYASELLTGGVGLALRDGAMARSYEAAFPRFLGEMGRSRSMRALRDSVTVKVGLRCHVSKAKARSQFLPLLERLLATRGPPAAKSGGRDAAVRLVKELSLTAEETGYLLSVEPDAPAVRELMDLGADDGPVDEPPSEAEGPVEADASRRRVQRRLGDF